MSAKQQLKPDLIRSEQLAAKDALLQSELCGHELMQPAKCERCRIRLWLSDWIAEEILESS